MPFLRFSRDRRGYETTALLHAYRRQGRSHPRILYWFRTPVDARVGRAPLDEDAIRLLEENHPGVEFDWPRILQLDPSLAAQESPSQPEPPRGPVPAPPRGPSSTEAARRGRKRRGDLDERPARTAEARAEALAVEPSRSEAVQEALPLSEEPPRAGPAADERGADDRGADERATPRIAAEKMFSIEDLARLRGRHAALLARIDQEIPDPDKAEALRRRADGLNPDTWVTADAVRSALEDYEQVYRELREALGRRRRRQRPTDPESPERPET